jgi:hypothetical protein
VRRNLVRNLEDALDSRTAKRPRLISLERPTTNARHGA